MSISWEWESTGIDVGMVAAAEYEDEGIYSEEEPEPDTYAMVLGGGSGGGLIVEGTADSMYGFAERVMSNAFGALQMETLLSRTMVAEWAGRPLASDDVDKLRMWLRQHVGPQVWALVASWDTDTPLADSPGPDSGAGGAE